MAPCRSPSLAGSRLLSGRRSLALSGATLSARRPDPPPLHPYPPLAGPNRRRRRTRAGGSEAMSLPACGRRIALGTFSFGASDHRILLVEGLEVDVNVLRGPGD